MNEIQLVHLETIEEEKLLRLMNHELVGKLMPLLKDGFSKENCKDADFTLVLHPDFWGWGFKIFNKIKTMAFNKMNLDSITILFPPSRTNIKAVTRFRFVNDGELDIAVKSF